MTQARIVAPHQTVVTEGPVPRAADGEVLIEVHRAGICGTDLHILDGDYPLARFPMTPGHEFSGVIASVGGGVLERRVGERVTADPNLPCGRCDACQRGEANQCRRLEVVGVTRDGGFARFVAVPESASVPIGDLSFEDGALVEPLACVVWGLKRLRLPVGASALLYGAGPMGALIAQSLARVGVTHVTAVDPSASRRAFVRRFGCEVLAPEEVKSGALKGDTFDLVVDATGIPAVLEEALTFVRPRGTLWVFGVAPSDAKMSISPYEVFKNDLTVVGSFAVNRTVPEAVALLQHGAVDTAGLVSHLLPLERFDEGFDLARRDPERMKVQFDLQTL
jgi:2-desacetyl-2-hydroxyethyl bacteriochlorophyllide A dehydrogenase